VQAPAKFVTVQQQPDVDALAPDGSEIRLLARTTGASMAHGRLDPGKTSLAVRHRTVEEIWYVLRGHAELWRAFDGAEEIVNLVAGTSLTLPVGTSFQFRTTGDEPFEFIMCTLPPWPGEGEAELVAGYWPVDAERPGA
jgi:mannose-6-phosphate isomerase-like protein (cupin superfamily)